MEDFKKKEKQRIDIVHDKSFLRVFSPFSLIRDFGKQNTRGNVSKISVSLKYYRHVGSKSTNHSPLSWRTEGQKVTLVAVIGGFRSGLSITRRKLSITLTETLESFPRLFCFPKSRINENGGNHILFSGVLCRIAIDNGQTPIPEITDMLCGLIEDSTPTSKSQGTQTSSSSTFNQGKILKFPFGWNGLWYRIDTYFVFLFFFFASDLRYSAGFSGFPPWHVTMATRESSCGSQQVDRSFEGVRLSPGARARSTRPGLS